MTKHKKYKGSRTKLDKWAKIWEKIENEGLEGEEDEQKD